MQTRHIQCCVHNRRALCGISYCHEREATQPVPVGIVCISFGLMTSCRDFTHHLFSHHTDLVDYHKTCVSQHLLESQKLHAIFAKVLEVVGPQNLKKPMQGRGAKTDIKGSTARGSSDSNKIALIRMTTQRSFNFLQ